MHLYLCAFRIFVCQNSSLWRDLWRNSENKNLVSRVHSHPQWAAHTSETMIHIITILFATRIACHADRAKMDYFSPLFSCPLECIRFSFASFLFRELSSEKEMTRQIENESEIRRKTEKKKWNMHSVAESNGASHSGILYDCVCSTLPNATGCHLISEPYLLKFMHDTLFSYFNFALPRRFFLDPLLLHTNSNYYCVLHLVLVQALLLCQAVCLDATKRACIIRWCVCFFFVWIFWRCLSYPLTTNIFSFASNARHRWVRMWMLSRTLYVDDIVNVICGEWATIKKIWFKTFVI